MRVITLAAATLLAAPAFAGGLAEPEPAPMVEPMAAPLPAPSYDWTGAYAGAQLGFGDVRNDLEGDGAIGGLHAGYMYDLGGFVVGAEADADLADISLGGGDSLDSILRLKARAGADLGRTLIYGTAGVAQARADVGGSSADDIGWLAGIGLSYQLTDNWMVGGEILGHRFEDFDGSGLDVDAATATLRASFRF